MEGIEPIVIKEYLIDERKKAMETVHKLSRALSMDDPCLNRAQIRALCLHFKVKSLAEVFALIDATG